MSDIEYSTLRTLTAGKLIRALARDGFLYRRTVGSHARYVHTDGRRVTVPYTRRGETFAPKTLRSIIERQAQWTPDDLQRVGLIDAASR